MTASDPMAPETLVAQTPECTLRVTATRPTPDMLRLQYRVRNTSAVPLYFLNQLWKNIGEDPTTGQNIFIVLPNLANIEVSPAAVTVSKKVVDVPSGWLVEVLHIPCLMRVAPDAEYTETVELPVPLMPYTVYENRPSKGEVVSRALHFELGYLVGLPQVESKIREVATPGGRAFKIGAFPASEQSLIGVGPFREQMAVVNYEHERPVGPLSTERGYRGLRQPGQGPNQRAF